MMNRPLTQVLNFTRRSAANCLRSEKLMRRLKSCRAILHKGLFLLGYTVAGHNDLLNPLLGCHGDMR